MTFDNVYRLLVWYFRKKWLNPPKSPGNHDMIYLDHRARTFSAEDVFNTVWTIEETVKKLTPRQRSLIKQLFTSVTPREIAKRLGVGERRIRQMRREIIDRLRIEFEVVGLLGEKKFFEPVLKSELS